jgi:hypothetical protein
MNKKYSIGVIAIMTLIALGTTTLAILAAESAYGTVGGAKKRVAEKKGAPVQAPIATSGDNVYIAWWTNKTGNDEVMFRASNDNGATFGHKMNLSNTTGADSQDAEIAASGNNVYVTWWERNQTSEEPVLRVSSDNGGTFGPILKLASNGTIGGGGYEEINFLFFLWN